MLARRFWIRGRVQGVFFRGSAQARARDLGITGHARNLADGRVFVEEAALQQFARWLQRGPPAARVDGVESEPIDDQGVEPPNYFSAT
jgi:acylphosphatase